MKLDFTDAEIVDLSGALTWSTMTNEELARDADALGLPAIAKQYRDHAELAAALQAALRRKIFFRDGLAAAAVALAAE